MCLIIIVKIRMHNPDVDDSFYFLVYSVIFDFVRYPINEHGNIGINARQLSSRATYAEANNASNHCTASQVVLEEGSARVSLARVFAFRWLACTE